MKQSTKQSTKQPPEEGLASLHSMLGCPHPEHRFLWNAALLYFAASEGSRLSFPLSGRIASPSAKVVSFSMLLAWSKKEFLVFGARGPR